LVVYSVLQQNIKKICISIIILVSFFWGISFAESDIWWNKTLISHTQDYSLYSYYDSGIVLLMPQHKW